MQSARDGAGALDPGLGPRGPRPESHSACREQPVESKTQGSSADTSIINAHTLLHVDRDFPGAFTPNRRELDDTPRGPPGAVLEGVAHQLLEGPSAAASAPADLLKEVGSLFAAEDPVLRPGASIRQGASPLQPTSLSYVSEAVLVPSSRPAATANPQQRMPGDQRLAQHPGDFRLGSACAAGQPSAIVETFRSAFGLPGDSGAAGMEVVVPSPGMLQPLGSEISPTQVYPARDESQRENPSHAADLDAARDLQLRENFPEWEPSRADS